MQASPRSRQKSDARTSDEENCGSRRRLEDSRTVRWFQEFKFREFKITKGILEKFGFSDNCKGCEAAASGTDARRHTDECRQRLEQLISR